jgi:hypothetical protein
LPNGGERHPKHNGKVGCALLLLYRLKSWSGDRDCAWHVWRLHHESELSRPVGLGLQHISIAIQANDCTAYWEIVLVNNKPVNQVILPSQLHGKTNNSHREL